MGSSKMKILFIAVILLFSGIANGYSQTFSEWFSQKKTQKKYLFQQIAALEIYAGCLKKGYDLASSGLETVRGFTRGEFDLHDSFISSLKKVSPVIRNNSKVAEIMLMQLEIAGAFGKIGSSNLLTSSDEQYVSSVKEKVLDECLADIDELLLVVTSGKVEMGDDERLKRLDRVYKSMREKSAFVQSFSGSVGSLIRQRESEQQSIKNVRRYYEID